MASKWACLPLLALRLSDIAINEQKMNHVFCALYTKTT
jgi:hypothetical protein